jgi:hypothetical protein
VRWESNTDKAASARRLPYILENLCDGIVSVVAIDGVDYFSRMTQEEWDVVTSDAKKTLMSGVGQGWSEDYCRTIVGSHLRDKSEEFRGLLWAQARARCHFADSSDKGRLLVSYGLGIERVVEAVLAESAQPLHYSEICKNAEQRSGRTLDVRQVHNAAAEIGVLLGRGVYGLPKHLRIAPASAAQVIEEAEYVVASGTVDRPHAGTFPMRKTCPTWRTRAIVTWFARFLKEIQVEASQVNRR